MPLRREAVSMTLERWSALWSLLLMTGAAVSLTQAFPRVRTSSSARAYSSLIAYAGIRRSSQRRAHMIDRPVDTITYPRRRPGRRRVLLILVLLGVLLFG